MITEDYVSFEVAKLLKEKGFDELCECAYSEGGQYLLSCYNGIANRRIKNDEVLDFSYSSTAPTLQMAMKWLREVYNLHCDIGYDDLDWFWDIISVDDMVPVEDRPKMLNNGFAGSSSYEEACEDAIRYCLENLI